VSSNRKTPPLRRNFDVTDPKFRRRAAAVYSREIVDCIAERHRIDDCYKERLHKTLLKSGQLYLAFQEHAAGNPDKQAIERLKGKVKSLLSGIDSADENTRYALKWSGTAEALHDTRNKISTLSAAPGRPSNHALNWWVLDMASFWVNILGRKFTIDYHHSEGVTETYSFLKDALAPLDPNADGLLTATRKVRTTRLTLADKN
jgi:hypothetical protein